MYCYGRALGNNPGPVAGSGSLTDAPMPHSCANKRWHFPLGCEFKGKLPRKLTGYEVDTYQQVPKGTEKLVGYGSLLDMAPHVTAHCRPQPRWLLVVVLPEKSRRCDGDDGEWWQSLCCRFDSFGMVSSMNMLLNTAILMTSHTCAHTHTHTHTNTHRHVLYTSAHTHSIIYPHTLHC